MWWVHREPSLTHGELEKTGGPPGRDVDKATGSTYRELKDKAPARDADPGVILALKVFIALRLNEPTKLAFPLKTRGSGSEPRAIL